MNSIFPARKFSIFAIVAILIATAGLMLGILAPASAADGEDWRITSYDLSAEADENGTIAVELEFSFDFGDDPGHGPKFSFVQRQKIDGDPNHYRVLNYRGVTARSTTGAPSDLLLNSSGDLIEMRIGDPDIEVQGLQTYILSMTIDGIINPDVAGRDEIYWNVVGSGFEVPIDVATISITAPADPQEVTCYTGEVGSTDRCDDAQISSANSGAVHGAEYRQEGLEPGDGLSVVAAYDAGTFPGAATLLEPRRTFSNSWGGTVQNWLITGVGSLAGIAGIGLAMRRGIGRGKRSKESADSVTSFLSKNSGADSFIAQYPELQQIPTQQGLRFHPPAGVSPAALGTLIDKVVHPHDVSAIIVDLAVRGYLTLEELQPKNRDVDWMLRATEKSADDLTGYDRTIYKGIFAKKLRPRRVSKLGNRYARAVARAQTQLYKEVTTRGWFVDNPQLVRARWRGVGIGLIVAGIIGGVILAFATGTAIFGIIGVALGIATIIYGYQAAAYTPQGKALAQHAEEFKTYLTQAVAPESGYRDDRIFSDYLPYAVALGVAEEWADAFTATYQGGAPQSDWYYGYNHTTYAYWWLAFSYHSRKFGAATQSAAVVTPSSSATPGSSGYSGFSGGFSGGGVGGGGGGGW